MALDDAQEPYGQSSAGLGALGIEQITNQPLQSNQRSTRAIVELAFFVIQKTTDLFGPDFPDFTIVVESRQQDNNPLAAIPSIVVCNEEAKNFGRFVIRQIRQLRKRNLRQIAVICHAETFWQNSGK